MHSFSYKFRLTRLKSLTLCRRLHQWRNFWQSFLGGLCTWSTSPHSSSLKSHSLAWAPPFASRSSAFPSSRLLSQKVGSRLASLGFRCHLIWAHKLWQARQTFAKALVFFSCLQSVSVLSYFYPKLRFLAKYQFWFQYRRHYSSRWDSSQALHF